MQTSIRVNSIPKISGICFLFFILLFSAGCKKFLEEKTNKKLTIPSTITDLDGILNNYALLNARHPCAGEVSADNYYLNNIGWAATSETHRNFYLWQKYDAIVGGDWSSPYSNIFQANIILEYINRVATAPEEQQVKKQTEGSAYFIRAFNYYALAQLFIPPYDPATANQDLGLPLRLNTDYNEISFRSSVQQTYDRIITDLQHAIPLLNPEPYIKFRPSRAAAYGLMSRTFLVMRKYNEAGSYADSALKIYDSLMNYNTLNSTATIPFTQFNKEVIYDNRCAAPSALNQSRAMIDSLLFNSYAVNDIRRTIFFRSNGNGTYAFKGNYTGLNNASLFTGIATDELYLVRAEANARAGNTQLALNDLNTLLINRWKTGTFVPLTTTDPQQALTWILQERRKELLYRTLRWSDLRRLNKEPAWELTLTRFINGQQYQLLPNSVRYTLQIERSAILRSGMQQNP